MNEYLPRVIRWKELREMLGGDISRSTIDRWEKKKAFPKRIKIGQNIVVWNLQAIKNWLQSH